MMTEQIYDVIAGLPGYGGDVAQPVPRANAGDRRHRRADSSSEW
jgi:hypothetical protein